MTGGWHWRRVALAAGGTGGLPASATGGQARAQKTNTADEELIPFRAQAGELGGIKERKD